VTIRLLVTKDLRVLGRSRILLGTLILYPLVLAVLLALVARDAGARPRVAYVDEAHLGAVVKVNSTRIDYATLLSTVSQRVTLVPMTLPDAQRALADGDVVAIIHIPPDFVTQLKSTVTPGVVDVTVRGGTAGERALREVQAFVYQLNAGVQRELLREALRFLNVVVNGGTAQLGSTNIPILGLRETTTQLAAQLDRQTDPQSRATLTRIRDFTTAAQLALSFAEPSLRTVAEPVVISEHQAGSDDLLGNHGVAVVLAVGVVLAAILLGAGALAQERDDNTLGRLVRSRVALSSLIAAKILHAVIVATLIGVAVAIVNAAVASISGTPAPPLSRLPLAVLVMIAAAAAAGAIGTLIASCVRDFASAALVAVLVALPFVIAGIVSHAGQTLRIVTLIFPFQAAVDGLSAALYAGASGDLASAVAKLVTLAIAAVCLTLVAARRLVR
jgi:ABC-type transport system involved in multi-copper enzyme maturation permease subunit